MNDEPQPTSEQEDEPTHPPQTRIYVASLSDYNAGRLHGAWVDAAQPAEVLHEAIEEMLAASPERGAEEWAIHDFEGFGPLRLSEYESIEHVAAVAQGIAEHGAAFAAWAAQLGQDNWGELDEFDEHYLGHWDSLTTYAEELFHDFGIEEAIEKVAGSLEPYVRLDAEALGRDLVLGGEVVAAEAPDGGVFLFQQ